MRSQTALQIPQPLTDSPPDVSALGLSLSDQSDRIERGLERSGWLRDAKRKLRGINSPEHAIDAVFELARSSTQALEVAHFDLKVDLSDDSKVRDALISAYGSEKGYYDHPQFSVWKVDDNPYSELEFQTLMEIFEENLNLQNPDIFQNTTANIDFEHIGSFQEFLSLSFWAVVNALHHAQIPWSSRRRIDELISVSELATQRQLVLLRDTVGQQIHTLRAKDTTGRWAKYFVHIDPHHDDAFTRKIDDNCDMDLEDWGVVVASEYEHIFRERQTRRVRGQFNRLIDSFERFSARTRSYSMGSLTKPSPANPTSFKVRRLATALSDQGSRGALIDELAEQAFAIGGSVERIDTPELPRLLFQRRLNHAASSALVSIIDERKLPSHMLAPLAALLTSPTAEAVDGMLQSLRRLGRYVGSEPVDFARFHLLVAQNRSLHHPHLLSVALGLAAKKESMQRFIPAIGAALVGLIALGPVASFAGASAMRLAQHAVRAERALPTSSWDDTSLHLAMFDLLTRLGGETATELINLVQDYCLANESDSGRLSALSRSGFNSVCVIADSASEPKPTFEGNAAVENAGIRIELNIVRRMTLASICKTNDKNDKRIWSILLRDPYILLIRSVSIIGDYIESKSYSEKCDIIRRLIGDGLKAAFDEADYPAERREAFVSRLIGTLLSHDRPIEGQWAEAVVRERIAPPAKAGIGIPDVAPAIWRDDKLPGDTPPDFIKRHYGPWLRADATGVTRPDIKRFDPTLYTALANWLKRNDLPADCPVPSKSEAVSAEFSKAPDDPSLVSAKLWVRKQAHQRYHKNV